MSNTPLGEFELIRRYFADAPVDDSVALGIGDDCALLLPASGEAVAVSIDTLVEGTHFLPGTDPRHVATRLLGAAVSDLAAMGAKPAWFTLALTLPQADPAWLQPFAEALAASARQMEICLVGGDTTRGPLTLSVQVHGFVPPGEALRRTGAGVGDLVCVTGTLGDSRAGLELLLQDQNHSQNQNSPQRDYLLARFYAPQPRIAAGLALRGVASACIDISDGLLADLGHIVDTAGLGADLTADALPLSSELLSVVDKSKAQQWALTGGEDFELCFTLPPTHVSALESLPVTATVVGVVSATPGIRVDGVSARVKQGYDHFSGETQ